MEEIIKVNLFLVPLRSTKKGSDIPWFWHGSGTVLAWF
jgi:hypothetical protein